MEIKDLKKNFLDYCKINKLEINNNQIKIIGLLTEFYTKCFKISFFSLFKKKK